MTVKRLKLSKDAIRLRYKLAQDDDAFYREHNRRFNMADGAKLFGISQQTFWHYLSISEKHKNKLPLKTPCPFCGKSLYDKFSDWVNDGSLDHFINWRKNNGN